MKRCCVLGLPLLVGILVLAGADPRGGADRLLRDGYSAFARGDLGLAAVLYDRAQVRSTEPARIAFDLACVQYRLALSGGDLQLLAEAEQNYRCCLEPTDPRRAAALYGLGNCLLIRGGTRHRAALAEALSAYEKCLKEPDLPDELADAARYNREIARLALLEARSAPASASEGPSGDVDANMVPPPENQGPESPPTEMADPRQGGSATGGDPRAVNGADAGNAPETSEPGAPGSGHLPPIPDDEQAVPLSPREAAAHLDKAAASLRSARQNALRARASQAPGPGVRDW